MEHAARALIVAAVLIATAACGSPAATTAASASCGIGYADHDVKVWIVGSGAAAACSKVTSAIRNGGSQPVTWDGTLSSGGYQAVCSDQLTQFSYEVVDTGGHIIGTSMCQYMAQHFGSSGTPTDPDLFGIIAKSG